MTEVDKFIQECQDFQPYLALGWKHLLNGILTVPRNQESLLQAYFVENLNLFHVVGAKLVLYESPLPGETSDEGMVDLIFYTNNNEILITETKYVTLESGPTARTKRRKHRKHVEKQVQRIHDKLTDVWRISPEKIIKTVFTNDELMECRNTDTGIISFSVSEKDLNFWKDAKIKYLIESESSI